MAISLQEQARTPLDAASLNWFKNIQNLYLLLAPATDGSPEREKKLRAQIETLIGRDLRDLVLQDLFDLEDWVLALLPKEQLAQRYLSLRAEYQSVFGDEAWKAMLAGLQPAVTADNEAQNRVEAQRLQEELHWNGSIRPWATYKREHMMVWTLLVAAVVIVFAGILARLGVLELSCVLFMAGVLGGAISTIQRIQSSELATARALMMARYNALNLGVVLSPLLGGIFALLMTLFLLAKLIVPGLFIPDVSISFGTNCPAGPSGIVTNGVSASATNEPAATALPPLSTKIASVTNLSGATNVTCITNANNITNLTSITNLIVITSQPGITGALHPDSVKKGGCEYEFFSLQLCFASGKDLVLLVLLAFVAGFSERLVPDLLTKLADAAKK